MAMQTDHLNHIRSVAGAATPDALVRQKAVRATYAKNPAAARVFDDARTCDTDVPAAHPIHGHVICGEGIALDIPVSVHKAVGGESDFPCPGELLAAALAGCMDTAIRMIANLKGITLVRLQVRVRLGADVRGTLMMDKDVPVGFQSAAMSVDLATACGMGKAGRARLLNAAEQSCVILQTLRSPPTVRISRFFAGEDICDGE